MNRKMLALALLLSLGLSVACDSATAPFGVAQSRATGNKVIEQNAEGKLIINGNELKIVSTIAQGDAAFFKAVSPYVEGESGGGGGFSIDAGDEGRNFPLVELLGAMYQGGAEAKLVLLKKGVGPNPTDADYVTAMEATSDRIDFRVPITAPNFGGGGSAVIDTMWAPKGLSFTQQQDDFNFVTYTGSTPYSKQNVVAVWSAWTGVIKTRALIRDAEREPFRAPRPW
jgi:hypothetical protein